MEKPKVQVLTGVDSDEKCTTFVIDDEDHTLGNSLRLIIMKNPDVTFCGYTIPHPSENCIHLRIQTREQSAVEALEKGLDDLIFLSEHIFATFKDATSAFVK